MNLKSAWLWENGPFVKHKHTVFLYRISRTYRNLAFYMVTSYHTAKNFTDHYERLSCFSQYKTWLPTRRLQVIPSTNSYLSKIFFRFETICFQCCFFFTYLPSIWVAQPFNVDCVEVYYRKCRNVTTVGFLISPLDYVRYQTLLQCCYH